jgi:hypothetical protein
MRLTRSLAFSFRNIDHLVIPLQGRVKRCTYSSEPFRERDILALGETNYPVRYCLIESFLS